MSDLGDTHHACAIGAPDTSQGRWAGCELIVVHATFAALWEEARRVCDDALARGFAFVMILHGAEAFADEHLLSEEDRQRATRFRQPRDRHNFVLGRVMAHRMVRPLDAALPCVFSRGMHGKPFFFNAPAFNLSHSDHWVACAVSQREPIGIDVETFARLNDYENLLPGVAHQAERHCIERAPSDSKLKLFKRCWTRKEAVLKAIGTGLSEHLQSIDVCLDRSEPVLADPALLRLVDLPLERVTAAVALDPRVPGIVVMHVST